MGIKAKILKELQKKPRRLKELKAKLGNDKKVARAVDELVERNKVVCRKGVYAVPDPKTGNAVECTLVKLAGKFGFARPVQPDGQDIFIPGKYLMGAMPGDTLLVSLFEHPRVEGSSEGEVLAVVKENNRFTGTVETIEGRLALVPDACPHCPIYIKKSADGGARDGEKAAVEILERGDSHEDHRAGVAMRFGSAEEAKQCAKALLYGAGLSRHFPLKAKAEAKKYEGAAVGEKETAGRRDYRGMPVFTIDSAETKDIDDAISLEKTDTGYRLGVHIADVSHYVTPDSPLDAEAFRRGTSVYFPGHVVPMLPFALSNGICSLNPKVDRLAFSALMEVDKDGRRYGAKFAKSVICSKARMTYNKVNKILAGDKGLREEYAFLVETAETMNNLAHALYKRRIERGALELDIPEAEIRVDENGKPVEIRFRERGESEKLIEEFMLQANEAVAEYMCKRELPTVYRVHENPDPDKLRVFASFARPFGYRIDPSKPEDTAQFQTVLRGAKNDPKQRVLPTLLLRSLARARYADECIGHYGLKAKFYLHFTSPIRRYPDLVAHRMLQKALLGEEFTAADETMCEEAADQSTNREQAADNCERDIDKLYIASYMQQFIGEEFDAEVSGVQSFGVFVALENGCEGLIRAELMTGDFYQYDEEHMAMVGRHTGKRFTIGTPMRVKLLAASDTTGQIDFAPADGSLPVSEKLDRPRREDTDRAPRGNRAERRRHSGKGRGGKPGKGKKPPTRKRR